MVLGRDQTLWQNWAIGMKEQVVALGGTAEMTATCDEGSTTSPSLDCGFYKRLDWFQVDFEGYYRPTGEWFFEAYNDPSSRNRCLFQILGKVTLYNPSHVASQP